MLWQRLVGPRPIVTRLVVAVAVAMTLILLLASGFVYWRVGYALDRQLDQDLDAWRTVVDRAVATGAQPPANTPGQTFQVYDGSGGLVAGNRDIGRLMDADRVARAASGEDQRFDVGRFLPPPARRGYRVEARQLRTPQGSRVVATAISRSKHDEALRELLLQLGIANLLTLAGASLVGYRTARAALDPVEAYRGAAQRAGAEQFGRLPVAEGRDDELSRLGHTLNDLLGRIESGAVRERQFLADASHELRSPLALMSTELEWARHRPRSAEEMTEVIASLQGQVGRLVALTDALLEVEELRAVGPLSREGVALTELVADAVRDTVPRERTVQVAVPDTEVQVNRRWLTIAVSNLLSNAVRHGSGVIRVEATREEERLRLVVRDDGTGFPADFRAMAFDRFSRADRSRTTPGSGLGLYLADSVAQAHDGAARILPGPGAAVELDVRA